MRLGETITASSTPDYDDWGWDSYWWLEEWIAWHKALKKTYGQDRANSIWSEAYNKQDFTAKPLNFLQFVPAFNNYLLSQEMQLSSVGKILSLPGNLIDNTVDTIDSLADGVANTVKASAFLLPAVLIGVVGTVGYLIYKEIKSGAGLKDLVALTPAGAAAKKIKNKQK